MESMKQALRRIDAALCTTAALASLQLEGCMDDRHPVPLSGPLDAPEYLWRGSAKPGPLSSSHLVPRPDTCLPNF